MGETRVDLLHLLEDLRDAYPGAIEETILTEIVANSLDSGATVIRITTDPAGATITVVDDGSGMQRRELARYHDIAASGKTRGEGIGFAGVGIKLGLLVCEDVLTETRRGKTHVASLWHLASRHRAPWKWVPPAGIAPERGTAVRLRLQNALSPLLDAGYVEAAVRRHFQPLLDPAFAPQLEAHYRGGVQFKLNGVALEPQHWAATESATLEVRLARRRKPSATGYLVRESLPLPEDRRGLAISTFGKVIKRGWDWLGVTPATPDLVGGIIEVPALAECLTLNKGDFIRTGPRGATYLAYRRAIQQVVSARLAEWGDVRDHAEQARRRAARPLERDLENVLVDLSDEFPLLATLVEHRLGGQRRLPIGRPEGPVDARALLAGSLHGATEAENPDERAQNAGASDEQATGDPAISTVSVVAEPPPESHAVDAMLPAGRGPKRPSRYGLSIQFEARPEDPEPGRLVQSTVWINEAHPAYRRALASRSEGYHLALAVALALAPLASESASEHAFVTAFLSRWGAALDHGSNRKRGAR